MDSYQLVLCSKTQRVCLHRIPSISISRQHFLDNWKESMIWQGGLKLTELNGILSISFIGKDGKLFASSKLPEKINEAIEKTKDSSRGYAVRLLRPDGNGYEWIGVAFRDRNDAFDFGVAINDYSQRKTNAKKPKVEAKQIDFSLKQGEKIKVNINKEEDDKQNKNKNFDFKNDDFWNFPGKTTEQPKVAQSAIVSGSTADNSNPFEFFSTIETGKKKVVKPSENLLNL